MGTLKVPVFYSEGIRSLDRLLRQLALDARVSPADRAKAREAASTLTTIMAQAQARTKEGNA